MRVLVSWASKLGGTEGIAGTVGAVLREHGFDTLERPAREVSSFTDLTVDGVVFGAALYGNRWPAEARRFFARHQEALRRVPVWCFSSGPLDASADQGGIGPSDEVLTLMESVGAQGHVTFGGRLEADAKGLPARAMAKTMSGDWRNPEQIRRWASSVAEAVPMAKPKAPVVHPAGRMSRLLAHGAVGWALCALAMLAFMSLVSSSLALWLHAIAAPVLFGAVSWAYFNKRGARAPHVAATGFVGTVVALDAIVVAGLVERSFSMFASPLGTWIPFVLIFGTAWATGSLLATRPWGKQGSQPSGEHVGPATPSGAEGGT